MRLKDKVALITGAGQGFGQGIAVGFALEHASLSRRVVEKFLLVCRQRIPELFANHHRLRVVDVLG